MKKISITLPVILLTMLLCQRAKAQDYRFAAGVRLSNSSPTLSSAISGKFFATDKTAVEALIAWGNRFGIGGLIEIHNPMPSTEGLQWFYGAGAYLGFDSDKTHTDRALMGAQGIIGLDYKFANLPLNLTLDWKPELNIIDNINFEPAAVGFTIRFTFGKSQAAQTVSE